MASMTTLEDRMDRFMDRLDMTMVGTRKEMAESRKETDIAIDSD